MKKVMLALSTFRQSERAVEKAIERAVDEDALLLIVVIVDVNVARYLVGTDAGLFPELSERCERDFLGEQMAVAGAKARAVADTAENRGIGAKTHVAVGRFGLECMKVVEEEKPDMIVTTRSDRPGWVRRFFGSPVDHIVASAGCPVIEV